MEAEHWYDSGSQSRKSETVPQAVSNQIVMGRSRYRQSRKRTQLTVDLLSFKTVWTEKTTMRAKTEAMRHVISLCNMSLVANMVPTR